MTGRLAERSRRVGRTILVCCCVLLFAAPAAAHGGGYYGGDTTIPAWLTAGTGGAVVVVSFLATIAMPDEEFVRLFRDMRWSMQVPAVAHRGVAVLGGGVGLVALTSVVFVALFGPVADAAAANAAVVVVWAGWWGGYTASVYLVGNSWRWLNPWRPLASAIPRIGERSLPDVVGVWPSVAGLLALVWVEAASPVASNPRLLALAVLGYTGVTVTVAALFGAGAWFERVDPVSRVFRWYGRLAPVQRTDDGLSLGLPASALVETEQTDRRGEVAFLVALLWTTTYDGLTTTPLWAELARAATERGVPITVLSLVFLLGGFGVFLFAYRRAAVVARATASTYVTDDYIARWFAPALLPIAAGYHLAHYAGYFLARLPALLRTASQPLAPVTAPALVLPDYFGLVQLGFVVVGHMLAVWVAHGRAVSLFAGVVKPIRSQYPFVLVMSGYTAVSVWIVSQPAVRALPA